VVTLFLHELAHTLGVPHRDEPNTVMSAQYSSKLAGFDETSRDLFQRAVDARLGRATPGGAPTPPVESKHPTLVIIVDETGNRIVGGNPVDDATLDGLLKLHFTDDKDTEVLIKTRDKAPQNVVLAIVQHAKAAGLQKVSIARE
jgi:biopolymer transport protein ExbD